MQKLKKLQAQHLTMLNPKQKNRNSVPVFAFSKENATTYLYTVLHTFIRGKQQFAVFFIYKHNF